MKLLIKSAKIIDPTSKHHNKIRDILIVDGVIKEIASKIKECKESIKKGTEKVFAANNLYLSLGWFDMHVNFGEPGYEQAETLVSGCNAAAKGGFTNVMMMPNSAPCIDNKGQLEFISNKTKDNIVRVYPAGTISKKQKGNEIVEMHDMYRAGCLAFTDDKNSLTRSEIMKIALLYAKDSGALIMNYPNEQAIANNGYMHEGNTSTELGLKGIPSLAEEMMVDRDISLTEYTQGKLHFSYLSVAKSVSKVKAAKKKGLNITADVALHNLFLTDKEINNFDTRYKVLPPLRTAKDNKALIKGLKDGSIDVICSDHSPQEEEQKKVEFDNAANGIIGLESAFGLIIKHLGKHLTITEIIEKIAINPRKILGISTAGIEEGSCADITLFNPDIEWEFTHDDIQSKSANTPFVGTQLKGKALAIYNKGKFQEC